jgi:hypothetical protein
MMNSFRQLHRYVFGALKAACRGPFAEFCESLPGLEISKSLAGLCLTAVRVKISATALEKALSISRSDESGNDGDEWEKTSS